MAPVDLHLLDGRPPRVVMLPTAAGQEGDERIEYWSELGRTHYQSLGFEAVVLPVITREDAFNPSFANAISGAGLVYLSGGSPAYLAETLRDTLVFKAIVEAWTAGTALGGCSAGACALTAVAGGFRHLEHPSAPGLGVIDHLAVIPHFDRFDRRTPSLVTAVLAKTPEDIALIGIDERTALVSTSDTDGDDAYTVMGEQSVWWIDRDGTRHEFTAGTRLTISKDARPVTKSA